MGMGAENADAPAATLEAAMSPDVPGQETWPKVSPAKDSIPSLELPSNRRNPFLRGFVAVFSYGLAVAITLGLVSVLPVLNYLSFQNAGRGGKNDGDKKIVEVVMPKVKPKPKPRPQQNQNQQKNRSNLSSSRSSLLSSLRSAGGRGAAWGGDGAFGQMDGDESAADVDARPMVKIQPKYPARAKQYGIHGVVRVLMTIGIDGKVADLEFLETPGPYGFEEVIREAVGKWVFQPAMAGGVPIEQKYEQPFKF